MIIPGPAPILPIPWIRMRIPSSSRNNSLAASCVSVRVPGAVEENIGTAAIRISLMRRFIFDRGRRRKFCAGAPAPMPGVRCLPAAMNAIATGTDTLRLYALLGTVLFASLGAHAADAPTASGIERQYFDPAVRAQDDFYRHVNGKWQDATAIPPDKAEYGTASKLSDDAQEELRALIEGLSPPSNDPDAQKIAALYAS